MTENNNPFADLTWADLNEWAGGKILKRGESYQKNGYVTHLSQTSDQKLVAWVAGTERYATQVYFVDDQLFSDCTCPYAYECKHAVAVILEYIHCLKRGNEVPLVSGSDRRLQLLGDDDSPSVEDDHGEKTDAGSSKTGHTAFEEFLNQSTKKELINIILTADKTHPAAFQYLRDQMKLASGNIKSMIRDLKSEIDHVSSEPAYTNYWEDDVQIPDYSGIRSRMMALAAEGYADELLDIGKYLFKAGNEQIEMSHDEGELSYEIADCLEVVFEALPHTSLSGGEKLLWAIDMELEDDYSVCVDPLKNLDAEAKIPENWEYVADTLNKRLEGFGADDDSYKRKQISHWAGQALRNSGREENLLELYQREAETNNNYEPLVKFLMEKEKWEKAEAWIHKGVAAVQEKWPGIADRLKESLCTIQEKQGNWEAVAAMKAEDFFEDSSLYVFEKVLAACKEEKCRQQVRESLINYLETGRLETDLWPLPAPEIQRQKGRFKQKFPQVAALLGIALHENRIGDIIKWYDAIRIQKEPSNYGNRLGDMDDKVANAIVETHPDRSVEIWKIIAEGLINKVNTSAYEQAGRYLNKIHKVLKLLGREKEWQQYLGQIRQEHARKRNLMLVLNSMEGKTILENI